MKILFNRNSSIGTLCLLLLLAAVAGACVKDEYAEKEKATVTMTFTTRAESTPQYTSSLLDNEQMKTLRVIVARHDDETGESGDILYNVKYSIEPQETSKTITFSELTINKSGESFDFYAIANEMGITTLDFENLTSIDLKNRLLNSPVIATAIDTKSIPQTAFKTILVKPTEDGSIQRENMQLEFVVAKVSLSFSNETGKAQTLSDVKIAGAKPDKGFLCNDEIPADVIYSDVTWLNTVINAGTEVNPKVYEYSPIYLFPGQNPFLNNGYILTATLNESDSRKLEMSSITGLDRGQELKINIRLYKEAVDTHIYLTWEVVDWQKSSNTVPSFD